MLWYSVACCGYSILRMRISSLYEIYPGATDGYTLTLMTLLLIRLVPPLVRRRRKRRRRPGHAPCI